MLHDPLKQSLDDNNCVAWQFMHWLMFLQYILSWFHYIIFIAHATEKTVFTLLNWVDINWDRRSLKQWQPLLSGFQIEWPVCNVVDTCTVCLCLSMKFVPRLVNMIKSHKTQRILEWLRVSCTCYSGRRRRVIKCFVFFLFLCLPILHFERWLVRGTLADSSSHVRPVNQTKWRQAIWNLNAYGQFHVTDVTFQTIF